MPEQSEISIRYWPEEDRPREKLICQGRNALSNAELLAIILGSGNKSETAVGLAKRILQTSNNNLHRVSRLSVPQLMQFQGVGQAKAIAVAASLELGRRSLHAAEPLTNIANSMCVFKLMQPLLGAIEHEEFWVLYLNNSNKILHKMQLSKGGLTGTIVDIRIVFKVALEYLATAVILVHNHPSGITNPSDADCAITKKIKNAGESLDIKVLDHIIVTEKQYFSFADDGLL
jgi:DNA repair protein RadC